MHIDLLSLYPHYIDSCIEHSLLKRAVSDGVLSINSHNLRDFLDDSQRVDGRLVGGGAGMLLRYTPCKAAIQSVKKNNTTVVLMSPSGKKVTPKLLQQYSVKSHLVILAGHYEGVDARIEDEVDDVISVCDLVLTQGVLAAMLFIDAMSRYIPKVLGKEESLVEESFSLGVQGSIKGEDKKTFLPLLEAPHYSDEKKTKSDLPPIPCRDLLQSGDHAKIEQLRFWQSLVRTQKNRPDLYIALIKTMRSALFDAQLAINDDNKIVSMSLFIPVSSLTGYRKIFSEQLQLPTWEEKGKILALRVNSALLVLYVDPLERKNHSFEAVQAHIPVSLGFIDNLRRKYSNKLKDWDKLGQWNFIEQSVFFYEKHCRFTLLFDANS